MKAMSVEKFLAVSQITCSSRLMPFFVDWMQSMEMMAVFGFGDFRSFFWGTFHQPNSCPKEILCLRETVSSCNLGKTASFTKELQERLRYCKTVLGMDLAANPCGS
jgi:hypothetical protein